jgi:Pyruvate/2-oxoacid:ferredoxin oxidoreductase delta subunit
MAGATMAVRNVVKIDEDKCTGCGLCAKACAEGAIQIVDRKARLVSDSYCDGLGACLGECPEGAITIEPREAAPFDEEAVKKHLAQQSRPPVFVCPGLAAQPLRGAELADDDHTGDVPSQLSHWPVQLKLVSPTAPYFADADLLLVADCVPVAVADFHRRFLRDHSIVLGCPKLDDCQFYVEKLTQILQANNLRSLMVVHMEVPCCSGLTRVAREAIIRSGKPVRFLDITVSLRGSMTRSEVIKVGSMVEAKR